MPPFRLVRISQSAKLSIIFTNISSVFRLVRISQSAKLKSLFIVLLALFRLVRISQSAKLPSLRLCFDGVFRLVRISQSAKLAMRQPLEFQGVFRFLALKKWCHFSKKVKFIRRFLRRVFHFSVKTDDAFILFIG